MFCGEEAAPNIYHASPEKSLKGDGRRGGAFISGKQRRLFPGAAPSLRIAETNTMEEFGRNFRWCGSKVLFGQLPTDLLRATCVRFFAVSYLCKNAKKSVKVRKKGESHFPTV